MQIVLGSRGDYSVRAVLHLARHPGRQRRREISQVMDIPDTYLPQILARLVRAGIARSTLGRHGGYELARPAESISLREVVEVAEGPIRSQKCVLRSGPCYWADKCAMHDDWAAAETALTDRLSATTFAQIARADWEIEQGPQPPPDAACMPRIHRPDR
jgi:Rrf2 family transcriptional regulator, iron-sulfur cluster assembly transcription factor